MGLRGPKKGTLWKSTMEKKAAQQAVYAWVMKRMDSILGGLYERSQGVWVEKQLPNGTTRSFKEPPNPEAAKILLEHAMGKPHAKIVHANDEDNPLIQPSNEQVSRILDRLSRRNDKQSNTGGAGGIENEG